MGNIIEEFFVALGFKVDSSGLDEMEKKLSGLKDLILGFSAAVTAASGAIGAFAISTANQIDDMADFATLNDISLKSLQELGYVAEQSDSSMEAFKQSVIGVNNILGQAAMGIGRGAKMFAQMGFEARDSSGKVKNVGDILYEVSERIKGMNRPQALAMLSRLGIDPTLLPMLQRSTEEIQALRDEMNALGLISKEDADRASELTDSIAKFHTIINALKLTLGAAFIPVVTDVVVAVNKWIISNNEFVKSGVRSFLETLTAIIKSTWSVVSQLVDGIIEAVKWFAALKVQTGVIPEVITRIRNAFDRVIQSVDQWIGKNKELIKTLSIATFTTFGAIIEWLANKTFELVDAFIDIVDWLNQFVDLVDLAKKAVALLIVAKIGAFFGALVTSLGAATTALLTFNGILAGTNLGLFLGNLMLGGMILVIGFLIYQLDQFYKGNDSILTQLQEKFPYAVDIAKGALIALGLGFFAFRVQAIAHLMALVARATFAFVTIGAQAIAAGVKMALGWVIGMGPIGWVIAAVAVAAGLIYAYWDELSVAIPELWNKVWGWVQTTFDQFVTWANAKLDAFSAWFMAKWDWLISSIKDGWSDAWGFVEDMASEAMKTVQGIIDIFDISGFLDKIKKMGDSFRSFLNIGKENQSAPHNLSDLSARKNSPTQNMSPQPGTVNADGKTVPLGGGSMPEKLGVVQQNTNVYNLDRSSRQEPMISPIGALGRAETTLFNSNSAASTVTQNTNISGTQIHITTPDPVAAGTEVKKQLERMTKRATRNGQTAVAL